jgi:hypothetical protein
MAVFKASKAYGAATKVQDKTISKKDLTSLIFSNKRETFPQNSCSSSLLIGGNKESWYRHFEVKGEPPHSLESWWFFLSGMVVIRLLENL